MTLLFDDAKVLEKAVGEEATRAILSIVEASKGEALTKGDLAELAKALQGDILRLEGKVETESAKVNGRIDKLAMQVKILIALTALAVTFFSPVAEKLVAVIK